MYQNWIALFIFNISLLNYIIYLYLCLKQRAFYNHTFLDYIMGEGDCSNEHHFLTVEQLPAETMIFTSTLNGPSSLYFWVLPLSSFPVRLSTVVSTAIKSVHLYQHILCTPFTSQPPPTPPTALLISVFFSIEREQETLKEWLGQEILFFEQKQI